MQRVVNRSDVGPTTETAKDSTKTAKDAMRGEPREEVKGEEEEGTKAEQSGRHRITVLTGMPPSERQANHSSWKLEFLMEILFRGNGPAAARRPSVGGGLGMLDFLEESCCRRTEKHVGD